MKKEEKDEGPYRPVVRPDLVWPLKTAATAAKMSVAEFVNQAIQRAINERADLKETS